MSDTEAIQMLLEMGLRHRPCPGAPHSHMFQATTVGQQGAVRKWMGDDTPFAACGRCGIVVVEDSVTAAAHRFPGYVRRLHGWYVAAL